MDYPIGMIPYTNMAPYREMGPPKGGTFLPCLPGDSITAIAEGRILAAAIPVGGLPMLGDRVEPVGMYGIAAKGRSMSVLLFSDRPFSRLDSSCTVHLTRESASSVRLLYLLMGCGNGFDNLPKTVTSGTPCNARLIIGDRALKAIGRPDASILSGSDAKTVSGSKELKQPVLVTDLAEAWHGVCGLPFVFARWVVRRDAPEILKQRLQDWLSVFREDEAELVERCIPTAAAETAFPPDLLREYFNVIRRSLSEEDLEGERRFLSEFEKYQRAPLFEEY